MSCRSLHSNLELLRNFLLKAAVIADGNLEIRSIKSCIPRIVQINSEVCSLVNKIKLMNLINCLKNFILRTIGLNCGRYLSISKNTFLFAEDNITDTKKIVLFWYSQILAGWKTRLS